MTKLIRLLVENHNQKLRADAWWRGGIEVHGRVGAADLGAIRISGLCYGARSVPPESQRDVSGLGVAYGVGVGQKRGRVILGLSSMVLPILP